MRKNSVKVTFGAAIVGLFVLSGCNTIKGIGKDVQAVGKGV